MIIRSLQEGRDELSHCGAPNYVVDLSEYVLCRLAAEGGTV